MLPPFVIIISPKRLSCSTKTDFVFISSSKAKNVTTTSILPLLSSKIDLKLTSSGNSKVRYNGKAQIIKGEELISEHKIKNHVIGSNNHITTTEKIPLDSIKTNGEYTLRLVIQYTNEKGHLKSLIEENQFTVDNLSDTNI